VTSLQELAEVGEVFTGIAAVSALGLGVWQVNRSERAASEASAYRTYDEYTRLCMENPELASFDVAKKYLGFKSAKELWDAQTKESERYLWFVVLMLQAFERIMKDAPDAGDWEKPLIEQIQYHQPTFRAYWVTKWRDEYHPKLVALVDRALEMSADA
jgi:hypothetical protein